MADVLPATEKVFMDLELMLNSTRQVVAYLTRDSPGPGQQEFHVLCLDERGCLLHHCRLPDPGDFETSYRNLLSAALAVKGTKAFVLAHRHEARSPVATVTERSLRVRLKRALRDAGIRCQDHIIFGPTSVWSHEKGCTYRYDCTRRTASPLELPSTPPP